MAFEFTIPFSMLPTRPAQEQSVSELDVPVPKPAYKKRKRNAFENKGGVYFGENTQAIPQAPNVVSMPNMRAPQTVAGTPTENVEYEKPTGKGYTGPFVEETETDNSPLPFTDIKEPEGTFKETTKDNWFSKMIRPEQDEIDAANAGQRWHWALEHRFMMPGSQWNETVWQGADRENAALGNMIRQQQAAQKGLMTPVASERQRSTMTNMWKQYLKDIEAGHFDKYGGTSEGAKQWAEAFRKRYESIFGEGSSVDLAPEAEVLGKRTELGRKGLVDARKDILDTETAIENINKWIASGEFNDPKRQKEITTLMDKIGQRFTARLGGDSVSMADAEKVRIQIQYLPESAREKVYETIRRYREALAGVMSSASAKAWSQNNYGKLSQTEKDMLNDLQNGKEVNDESSAIAAIGDVADLVTNRLSHGEAELPTDIASDLKAIQEQYEAYMNNMVLAANVAPNVLYEFAKYLHDQQLKVYNNDVKLYGRSGDVMAGNLHEIDREAMRTAVAADPLLEPPTFIAPSLSRKPKGDITSNPQSKGEQQPAAADAGVQGVVMEGF